MLKKKVCMIGAPGVGKTSLVRRFVEGIFGERYHTTLGVKIDRKVVRVGDRDVLLVLWDIAGMDELSTLSQAYLRGTSGLLLVADGTRGETLDAVLRLERSARESVGDAHSILLLNKVDLAEQWDVDPSIDASPPSDAPTYKTSAKTGLNVEPAFVRLATQLAA